MSETSPGARAGWIMLKASIIAATAAWCFWPAQHGSWLWDDDLEVVNNPLLRDPGGWWKPWISPAGMDYFPLKDTFHWMQWRLWGDAIVGYHLTNLALHILGAWLLWRLLAKLGARQAWIGGLLFAVHPVTVESVAWIAEFKNTASLPFVFLAMSAYVDYDSTRRIRDLVCALAWFVAAMLCKSTVVMLPLVLLVFAWWRHGRIRLGDLRATAPFFAISLVLGLVTLWFQGHRAMGDLSPSIRFWPRLGQAGWNVLAYARECVFPAELSPVYDPLRTTVPSLIAWIAIGAVLLVAWLRRDGWGRHVLFGCGWFLLNLVPVLGIVPMSYLRVAPRADHFVYISLAAVAGLACAGLGAAWESGWGRAPFRRSILSALGLVAVTMLALTSRTYAAYFRSEDTLWREAVVRSPDAWLARNNLGRVLLREGHAEDARAQFDAAITLDPGYAIAHNNLGLALTKLGQWPQAMAEYHEALRLKPELAEAHLNLGNACFRLNRVDDAVAEYRLALRQNPRFGAAHRNLATALHTLGHDDEARAELAAATAEGER